MCVCVRVCLGRAGDGERKKFLEETFTFFEKFKRKEIEEEQHLEFDFSSILTRSRERTKSVPILVSIFFSSQVRIFLEQKTFFHSRHNQRCPQFLGNIKIQLDPVNKNVY